MTRPENIGPRAGWVALSVAALMVAGLAGSAPRGAGSGSLTGAAAVQRLRAEGSEPSLRAALLAARYRAEPEPAAVQPAYRASNPAQRLAVRFAPRAMELTHSGPRSKHQTRVSLNAVGRGSQREAVRTTLGQAVDNRVEYAHRTPSGVAVREWYLNEPAGLEQGFVLPAAPAGSAQASLTLTLAVAGDLDVDLLPDGQRAHLRDANGEAVLSYGGLKVWDAEGRVLASRLQAGRNAHELQLAVQDADAVYPVTIDPVWTQQQLFSGSDSVNGDRFGNAIALDANTVVVGSYLDNIGATSDPGSAFIFTRSGTTWTQQAKLTASDAAANDEFGTAVGISGNTVTVGAPRADIGANVDQGAAYVFTRTGTTWTQQQKLVAADGSADDQFGTAVDVDANTAVVGAYFDDTAAVSNHGSAYVWTRSGVTWTLQQKLVAADAATGDRLGVSVAVDVDTIITGAYQDNVSVADQGSAYVWTRSGATWTEQQQLIASDAADSDQFGWSVALSGNTAVVGADFDDVGANANQGSAYVFLRSSGVWMQQAQLFASDGAANDKFGWSVGVDVDTAVVGAYAATVGANAGQGAAYVYGRSGTAWSQQQKLTAATGNVSSEFGIGVTVQSDTVLVGADRQNNPTNNGAVFAFTSQPSPPVITAVAATGVSKTAATITWTTDVSSSSTVEYGVTNALGSTATGAAGTSHTVSLPSLTAGRTYFYRVRSITTGGTAPVSESISPAGGNLLFVTAPNVGTVVAGFSMRRLAGTIFVPVTVTNTGASPVTGASLTAASLRGTGTGNPSTPTLPASLGVIPAGGSVTTTLQFSGGLGVAGATGTLTLGVESSDGTIGIGYRTTLP